MGRIKYNITMRMIKAGIVFFIVLIGLVLSVNFAFASSTDGTIDSTYKYAWGENIGWVNFGTSNGNVHVTDSGLSGYALSENVGWINLNNVANDGQGNLSGYAWGENVGWINFAPTNGGVVINSSGEFTGSALGENIGWIIFNGDYKVKTDWRPRSARPACNNSLDDDADGKTDYPADPGCSSLDDTDETDTVAGGGIPGSAGGGASVPESKLQTISSGGIVTYISEFIEKVPETLAPLIPEFLKPKPPEIKLPKVPVEELVPKQAPLALAGKWNLLSPGVEIFVLAPLPSEIRKLAEKFPELGETLKKVGITKITDIEKLKTVKLSLPPVKEAGRMPAEIVFAKTAGEKIDFNIALSVTEKGEPQQKISTISGKPLQLVIKPDKPVKSVKGYVVFKSKQPRQTSFNVPFNQLAASVIFANPVFAKPQEQPVRVEEKLVLQEFEYTDPDGDGIYTAEIQAPVVEGEYEIITVMDYEDPQLAMKQMRLITVVDPEGYIFEKEGDRETRIPGAIISLFWLNSETKQYQLWPAKEYQQENPQTTDVRGTYSFLVPEGYYYLKVEAPGYLVYDGKPFQVKEGSGIHVNIELKTKYWWLKVVDWKTVLLIAVILLLLYNFYRDKIRERLLNKKI